MNKPLHSAQVRNLVYSLNSQDSESSFADLNPLPKKSAQKSVHNEFEESIEINAQANNRQSQTRSVEVSVELIDDIAKSVESVPLSSDKNQLIPSILADQKSSRLPLKAQTSRQEMFQPKQPEVNTKFYSQLAPSEERLDDSISSSHAHPTEEKKNSVVAGLASGILGGLVGLGVFYFTQKKRIAFTVGGFVSLITFSTIHKST